jgi:aryl-alcohol dehydrogenase-like predicted oxidoreductase
MSMLWQERLPLLPFCVANGTGVIAYGPLAFGLLTGGITSGTAFPDDDWRSGSGGLRAYDQLFAPGRLAANLHVVSELRPLAERLTISLPQLALAWVLHQDGVSGAIAGSRSAAHIRENAAASGVKIESDVLDEIGLILRGRGEIVGR